MKWITDSGRKAAVPSNRFCILRLFLALSSTAPAAALADAPSIINQPVSLTNTLGSSAFFGVLAEGAEPLTYQWYQDCVLIPNETNAVLALTDVGFDDEGAYSVSVSCGTESSLSSNASLVVNSPRAGDIDYSFLTCSRINGSVLAADIQPDGKILIAGGFTTINGALRGRIARLNADGSTDHSFMNGLSGADGSVRAITLQPDGKVLVAGAFRAINAGSRNCIARLNADGTLDPTFADEVDGNSTLLDIALQPDGKVLIGGGFYSVGGVSRRMLARLNSDGTLDTSFMDGLSGMSGSVSSISQYPDGRVAIGGYFTTVHGISRQYVARLHADGSLDTGFMNGMIGADSFVYDVVVQPDGKVLTGGTFWKMHGIVRQNLARLNQDGSLDTNFLSGVNGPDADVHIIKIRGSGDLLVGGSFQTLDWGIQRPRLARLHADGTPDTNFLADAKGPDDDVATLAAQPDGRVIVGGGFSRYNETWRGNIARIHPDGALDQGFLNPLHGPDALCSSLIVQPDAKVVVGGTFTNVNGIPRRGIARFNENGSLDTGFLNDLDGPNDTVGSIALQPDSKLLIAGLFTNLNGVEINALARLNSNGSLDHTFQSAVGTANPWTSPKVFCTALQNDGKVVIAGQFESVDGVGRTNLARLNADGTLDPSFVQNGNQVTVVRVQPDQKLLIGGTFIEVDGVPRRCIARLHSDGSLDTSFLDGLDGVESAGVVSPVIYDIALQPDGRMILGGEFDLVNGVSRANIARLNPDGSLDTGFLDELGGAFGAQGDIVYTVFIHPDGRILVGGWFETFNGISRRHVARLNPDGSLDSTFLAGLAGPEDAVGAFALSASGRILVAGRFTTFNQEPAGFLTRLYGSAEPSIDAHRPITGMIELRWLEYYLGWHLEAQSVSHTGSSTSNWSILPGSETTNRMWFTVDPTERGRLFRLARP